MSELKQDLELSVRQLIRNPGFTLVVVITLALGIGANTAIFSVVDGVLLKPLPYDNGERLVRFGTPGTVDGDDAFFSVQEMQDLKEQVDALAGVMEYHSMDFTLLGHGDPDRVKTGVVSADFFEKLGVTPIFGRGFRPADAEPGADPVVLLTHRYWQSRFRGDESIVGETMTMNDRPLTVVGVLPPLPEYPGDDHVYITTEACPFRARESAITNRKLRMVRLFGLLEEGVEPSAAQADVQTVMARMRREHPEAYTTSGEQQPVTLVPVREDLSGNLRKSLLVLFGAVTLVLLLACANVANLLLTRLNQREREVSLRAALGASRRRLVRQLLTETVLLALIGGAVGAGLAAGVVKVLSVFAKQFTLRAGEIVIDWRVLLFAFAVSLATGLLFGLLPAFQVRVNNLAGSLKEGGRTSWSAVSQRLRKAAIVAQVAISFVLLVGAGLLIRSFMELQDVDPGFSSDDVLSFNLALPYSKYPGQSTYISFYDRLLDDLTALPTVTSAALASEAPLSGAVRTPTFEVNGLPAAAGEDPPAAGIHVASEDYFDTLGIPVLRGRSFRPSDDTEAPTVILINQAAAERYWMDGDPVGDFVVLRAYSDTEWNVIGVVGNVHQTDLTADAGPAIYFPYRQVPGLTMQVLLRTRVAPEEVVPAVRSLIRDLDPELPVTDVRSLASLRSEAMAPSRLAALLLAGFGLAAYLITFVGIAGVVAFSVSQRTQEIGVRSALGASRREIFLLILRQGLVLGVTGISIGLAGAFATTRWMSGMLFEVQPGDPWTFALISAVLLLAVLIATVLPARRATAITPTMALRTE